MYQLGYSLDSAYIDELLQRMHRLIESATPSQVFGELFHGASGIPSHEHLTALLDNAFWTSFSRDEGNAVTISIIFDEPVEAFDTFLFDQPIPFDVKNLVKLGAALENPRADIGVWPDENGDLTIWGFTTRSEGAIIANLWVQALAPGRVLVTFGGKSIAALIQKKAVFIDHTNLMKSVIPKLTLPTDDPSDRMLKMIRYTSLLSIARSMRAHGRGGTLLAVPDSEGWRRSIQLPAPYTGGASFLESNNGSTIKPTRLGPITDFFANLVKTKESSEKELFSKMRHQVEEQCRHIAKLTAVDGALTMNFDRFVFCFGAKIITAALQDTLNSIRVVKPVESDTNVLINFQDLGGTRHQSAAIFAHAQPGSIAIVASQDGDVTFITTDTATGELLAVSQAELAVLHEGFGAAFWSYSRGAEMELI